MAPETAVGPQESHCPVRPQTHWKQCVKAGLLVTNNKNRLEQMNTEKGPHLGEAGVKQLSEPAETGLRRNPGGQADQEGPPGCLPISESSSAAATVNLSWPSWTLGRALAWPCLGPAHPTALKRERVWGLRAATEIGGEHPASVLEGAKESWMATLKWTVVSDSPPHPFSPSAVA